MWLFTTVKDISYTYIILYIILYSVNFVLALNLRDGVV